MLKVNASELENNEMKLSPWLIILLSLLLAACAARPPAPTESLALARAAITSAEDAGAREQAPMEFREAQQKLERAEQANTREDYYEARRLAEQAQIDARYAAFRARSARSEKAIDELENSIADLRAEVARSMEDTGEGDGQ